jgi:hypothetical protein
MTHARHFPAVMMHVQLASAVLDDGRFVVAVSCGPSPIPATAAGFSIVSTAAPLAGIPRCSNVPSDALAENSFRIPSTNTFGFAVDALDLLVFPCCLRVDFSDDLTDLDWGSWEGSLPESSSLGGDGSPLRGAFFIDSASSIRGFKNSLWEKLYQLCAASDILIAIDSRRPDSFGPPKRSNLSPPPTNSRFFISCQLQNLSDLFRKSERNGITNVKGRGVAV